MSPSPPTRFTLNLFFYQTRKGPVWYPGMLPRCGTKVCYRGVVSRCGTYRTPRTFFPLWRTYGGIAIFFMLCGLVFSSTMLILNSNRLFDIAMDPDTVDFSCFQAAAASSRTWSPRLHTPPRGWLLMKKWWKSQNLLFGTRIGSTCLRNIFWYLIWVTEAIWNNFIISYPNANCSSRLYP